MPTQLELFIATAMHLHDPYSNGHGQATAQYAMMIALAIRDEVIIDHLQMAARLHDIGKLFVDESLINKTTTLTQLDWSDLRQHTTLGHFAVMPLGLPYAVQDCILHHHENYDGSGYPHGLIGGNIPIYSRIVRVADSYEAMICDRPYRVAKSKKDALIELEKGRGSKYDPEIVTAFVDGMLKKKEGES